MHSVVPQRRVHAGRVAVVLALAALLAGCSAASTPTETTSDFAGLVDIGGRSLYLECRGAGAPTVVLISGTPIAGDLWEIDDGDGSQVLPAMARHTRTCVYDRPGTTRAGPAGGESRSDPIAQPTTTKAAVADLRALLDASGEEGPFVLAAHSYGGLVARLYANAHPDDVSGLVLIDSFSPELQENMTAAEWQTWKQLNTHPEHVRDYPDIEQIDFDVALSQVREARDIRPLPLIVLTADAPPEGESEFGAVITRSHMAAQGEVAQLVPGARHLTDTDSGHNMMIDQPQLVIDAILEVVAAVHDGRTSILDAAQDGPRSVDVGDARVLHAECRGSGAPTIMLISGTGGAGDDWTHVGDPADPQLSDASAFARIALFARVCMYDRPGTASISGAPNLSTPVDQPTTAQQGAADLEALLAALGEPGPTVLVAASWGGLIAQDYARRHPDRVAGLVFVDAASPHLTETLTPTQWENWMAKIREMSSVEGAEVPDYDTSLAALAELDRAPAIPTVVLTSDEPWDLQLGGGSTWPAWLAAQDRLASSYHADHIVRTNSGHAIAIEQPEVVVDAVRDVIDSGGR